MSVSTFRTFTIVCCLSLLTIGCGGGASTDVTCASFQYQEDAQANYMPKLDRDNDGIACEDLPHRPTASNPTPTPPIVTTPTPTVVQTTYFTDNLARQPVVQSMSDATYRFSVSAFYQPVRESTQTATATTSGATTLSPSRFMFFTALPNTFLSYFSQGSLVSEGIGFSTQSTVGLSALVGDYNLIGRKCENDSSDRCELLSGAAKIQADGAFVFCPQSLYSQTCPGRISSTISNTSSPIGKFVFNPSTGLFGGLNTSSTQQYGIAVFLNIGSSVYSLFGQLTSHTAAFSSGNYRIAHITSAGYVEESAIYSSIAPNSPLPGFSTDQNGTVFLRSASGLFFSGTPRGNSASASLKLQTIQ